MIQARTKFVMRCDATDCDEEWKGGQGVTQSEVMQAAEEAGWKTTLHDGDKDYCPEHNVERFTNEEKKAVLVWVLNLGPYKLGDGISSESYDKNMAVLRAIEADYDAFD